MELSLTYVWHFKQMANTRVGKRAKVKLGKLEDAKTTSKT